MLRLVQVQLVTNVVFVVKRNRLECLANNGPQAAWEHRKRSFVVVDHRLPEGEVEAHG